MEINTALKNFLCTAKSLLPALQNMNKEDGDQSPSALSSTSTNYLPEPDSDDNLDGIQELTPYY